MGFLHCAIGGTFDHFHAGHKALIDKAFSVSQNVTIGITASSMLKRKSFSSSIEDFQIRKKEVELYLKKKKYDTRAQILQLTDIYGTTTQDSRFEALVVTEETVSNGQKINAERQKKGMKELTLVTLPYVLAEDKKPITSERIRMGEIDRDGLVYKLLMNENTLTLPDNLRTLLRKPLGTLIEDKASIHLTNVTMIISVGDISTIILLKNKLIPDVQIIDYKTQRGGISSSELSLLPIMKESQKCKNPAGIITKEAWNAVFSSPHQLIVDGEEDLLTLPAVLSAPLGSVIIYGQYQKGKVIVEVTEEKKKEVVELLNKFM